MARIELPPGLIGTENLPRTKRILQNIWNNGNGKGVQRPGISSILTTSGDVARGLFEWNGSLYKVVSQTLRKITNVTTGASSAISGTIAGSAPIKVAIGFNTATIVVPQSDGNIYTLDSLDTLTEVWDGVAETGNSNFVSCIDLTHINGRFVYIPFNGDPAFFSDVGAAGTVQSDAFFDAENLPDKNNAVFNGKDTLFITGTDSIQLFVDTGEDPVPFAQVTRSRILNGFIGGLLEYNNTFLFIGREKGEDQGIYSIVQGGAAKISNETVDLILSKTEESILAAAVTGRFKWRGYDIAHFSLADDSFAFFGGEWFRTETLIDGVSKPWTLGFLQEFEKTYYSLVNDKFGKLAKVNTDYGERMTRIMTLGFEQEDGEQFTVQSLELGMSQGFNNGSGSVALSMSNDGLVFGEKFFIDTGDIGDYNNKMLWNFAGGLGTYPGFMGAQLYTAEDIEMSVDYVSVKFR